MTKIWQRLYLGNLKDAGRLAGANPFRITGVVSLCEELIHRNTNISYVHVPISDSCPLSERKFAEVMSALATSIEKGTVLVHCVGGMSRSPIVIAAWMHRCGYANFDQALGELAELREIAPSPVLLISMRKHLTR